MNFEIITNAQIKKRRYWVDEIAKLSGNFGVDSNRLELELSKEMVNDDLDILTGHLRLCGAIPEQYCHDTTEEKLYSKYTDILLSKTFERIGLTSLVLKERADAADVECFNKDYSFVADAKAFRLSRTAKNQKDFKVQAMDNWKRGKPYALIVCPIYQLPTKQSQIYQQATTRSVCIFSYTHLIVVAKYAKLKTKQKAQQLLHDMFKTIETLNPSKDSLFYWRALNQTMIGFDPSITKIWSDEKKAAAESIYWAKEESLEYLASERARIVQLSREEAIKEIIRASKIDQKIKKVKSVDVNGFINLLGG